MEQNEKPDVLCFMHLRWNSVHQRPHHLMKRCSVKHRVFYWEEVVFEDVEEPKLKIEEHGKIFVVRPLLPHALAATDFSIPLRTLLNELLIIYKIERPLVWYYAPMAIGFAEGLASAAVVYDCMDELSAFRGAPQEMVEREQRLLRMADVVFAGGHSLFESKRKHHSNIHSFPSSIDFEHFLKARSPQPEPLDQAAIPHPRAGFYGVIDERFDFALIAGAATLLPDVHFVLIGPVVKVADHELPRAANLHYLGQKSYDDLPPYLSGWEVALIPFALNESTKYVSPTKTPEYLAAARPVVSTPITDVIATYGSVVRIASAPEDFAAAITAAIADAGDAGWIQRADDAVSGQSWDTTWSSMWKLVATAIEKNEQSLLAEKRDMCTTI